jgi:hypothetical protein
MFIGLGLGLRQAGNSTGAARLAGSEANVLAMDFRDMSMIVRDTGTPANNFVGNPNSKLTYSSPSSKLILGSNGLYAGGTTLRTEFNSSASPLGIRVEPAATNLCLRSNDLTNASWTKSNMTTSLTATGADGVINSATICTATAANATALQAITSTSQARITSVALRRRTGTGNIDLTQDNGTTWTPQAITSSWTIYSLPSVTSANPTVGIRIVTSGDAVDVQYFQHEIGSAATSAIETVGSTVTRARDNLPQPLTIMPFNQAGGTWIYGYTRLAAASEVSSCGATYSTPTTNDNHTAHYASNGANVALVSWDGSGSNQVNLQTSAPTFGVASKLGFAYAANNYALCRDGGTVLTDTSATLPTPTDWRIGSGRNAGEVLNGYLSTILYLPRRVSDSELQALTS